jgi:chromosome partitioning protein
MAIISLSSSKGGVSKTTLALLIGTELTGYGYRVILLDCDINQHASAFGEKCSIPGFKVLPDIGDSNILPALREAEAEADVVLVDLAGETSKLNLKALHRSSFVLIPCQASLPDVRDAVKTVAQVDEAQELARVTIARSLVWTRVPPGFESRSARHVRKTVEGKGLPIFRSTMMERAAFREMHLTGKTPRQSDPKSSAATNVAAITNELLTNLETLAKAA